MNDTDETNVDSHVTVEDVTEFVRHNALQLITTELSRDELQGVVAHEFSHIFNGDMRINIRLIGVIHGLLVLGVTGWFCLRFIGPAMLGSGRRSSSKNDGGGGIGIAIMLFGLALMLCGFIGTFFGQRTYR